MSAVPDVCFAEDICRLLGISRTTLKRLRRARVFPIPELPALDRKARWSGTKVREFIDGRPETVARRRFG